MPKKKEWWRSFFRGPYLDVQRQAASEADSRQEAEFIETALGLTPGARILDVPCGEGRVALELASRGYAVTGVDITPPFLADARRQAKARGLVLTLHRGDMRELPWRRQFDAACCLGGSFGFFDDDGNLGFLKAVARTLRPRGAFLLFTHVVETLFPKYRERDWEERGEMLMYQERTWDHAAGRIDATYTLVTRGKSRKMSSSIRLYTYRELCDLMAAAGFGELETYSGMEKEAFKFGSPRLWLTAHRTV